MIQCIGYDSKSVLKSMVNNYHHEIIDKFDKVERYGYVPMSQRITDMIKAGNNLAQIRADMCDFHPEDDIDWSLQPDPTIAKDFDQFQAMETMRVLQSRYADLQKRLEASKQSAERKDDSELAKQKTDESKDA